MGHSTPHAPPQIALHSCGEESEGMVTLSDAMLFEALLSMSADQVGPGSLPRPTNRSSLGGDADDLLLVASPIRVDHATRRVTNGPSCGTSPAFPDARDDVRDGTVSAIAATSCPHHHWPGSRRSMCANSNHIGVRDGALDNSLFAGPKPQPWPECIAIPDGDVISSRNLCFSRGKQLQ